MVALGDMDASARIEAELMSRIQMERQLVVGDSSWRFRSFADLLAEHGKFFAPAPWPVDHTHPQRMGECFAAAHEWADRQGWTYVEGMVYLAHLHPVLAVIDHAWCVTSQGMVADPALPDGVGLGYLGIAITDEFRHAQRHARGTNAVFTGDPVNVLAGHVNTTILREGIPADAVAAPNRLLARPWRATVAGEDNTPADLRAATAARPAGTRFTAPTRWGRDGCNLGQPDHEPSAAVPSTSTPGVVDGRTAG